MAEPPTLSNDDAAAWFEAEVPDAWFTSLRALVDRDEIMIVGTLTVDPTDAGTPDNADDAQPDDGDPQETPDIDEGDGSREANELHHIAVFREHTRDARVAIAQRAEAKYRRKVAWAVACGETQAAFTHLNVPVMTRLRIDERQVLDTLVAAGAARSRSDALVWCVRQIAKLEGEWLDELRGAINTVDAVRAKGPG